jgi:hypothetical protein
MAPLVFAALIVTAIFAITWGTTAAALRQSHQEQQVAMEEMAPESGWSITETGGGTRVVDQPRSPPHVVTADAARIGQDTHQGTPGIGAGVRYTG